MTRKHWKYIFLHIKQFDFFSFSEYFKVGSTKIWVLKCFNYLGALFTLLFLETNILELLGSLILADFTLPDSEVARYSWSHWMRRTQVPCFLWNTSLWPWCEPIFQRQERKRRRKVEGEKEKEKRRGGLEEEKKKRILWLVIPQTKAFWVTALT